MLDINRFSYKNDLLSLIVFYILLPVAFLFGMHGAVGYQNFKIIKTIGFLIIFISWLFFFTRQGFRVSNKVLVYLVFLFLFSFFAVYKEILFFDSTDGFQFFAINVLILFLFVSISKEGGGYSIYILYFSAFFISLIAVYLYFFPIRIGGLQFGLPSYFRMIGPFSTPNRFAEVPAVGAILAYFLYLSNKNKFFISSFVFFIVIAFLAGSKGSLFALLVSVFISMFLLSSKDRIKNLFIMLSVFFVVASFMIVYNIDLMRITKMDMVIAGDRDITSGRLSIWYDLFNAYINSGLLSTLLGNGVNGFYNLSGFNPHSTYFLLVFDYGVFLLVFYVFTTVFFMYKFFLSRRSIDRLYFIILVYVVLRGVSMPNFMVSISFSMLAYWSAVGWYFSQRISRNEQF